MQPCFTTVVDLLYIYYSLIVYCTYTVHNSFTHCIHIRHIVHRRHVELMFVLIGVLHGHTSLGTGRYVC